MSEIIRAIESEQLKKDLPKFNVGDTLRVMVKVVEGDRERLQAFEGICNNLERRYQEMSRQFGVPVEHIRQQLPPMQLSHDLKLAYARAVVVDSGVRL